MTYSIDHKNDTLRAIGESTSKENTEILQELVHIIFDGQMAENGKAECKNLLQKLEKNEIVTIDELCGRFMEEGVDKDSLDKYKGDKKQFLIDRLLPPYSPNHQLHTHKGWDYDYSLDEDKDCWSALEIKQSWEVKKYLLIKTVGIIYILPESRAQAIAVLLYDIHRLRDIQYNNYDAAASSKKDFLINACGEIEKYVFPFIFFEDLKELIHSLVNDIKDAVSGVKGPINDDFWQSLNTPIDKLIGSIDNSQSGLARRIIGEIYLIYERICVKLYGGQNKKPDKNTLKKFLERKEYEMYCEFMNRLNKMNLSLEWESGNIWAGYVLFKNKKLCDVDVDNFGLEVFFKFTKKTVDCLFELDIDNGIKERAADMKKTTDIEYCPITIKLRDNKRLNSAMKIMEYVMNTPDLSEA